MEKLYNVKQVAEIFQKKLGIGKSTFYKYFKEYYQVSPGDYKRFNKNGNN